MHECDSNHPIAWLPTAFRRPGRRNDSGEKASNREWSAQPAMQSFGRTLERLSDAGIDSVIVGGYAAL